MMALFELLSSSTRFMKQTRNTATDTCLLLLVAVKWPSLVSFPTSCFCSHCTTPEDAVTVQQTHFAPVFCSCVRASGRASLSFSCSCVVCLDADGISHGAEEWKHSKQLHRWVWILWKRRAKTQGTTTVKTTAPAAQEQSRMILRGPNDAFVAIGGASQAWRHFSRTFA